MTSTLFDRRIPAILAGASLIAASICISVSYVISAIMMAGLHFSDDATETAVAHHDLIYSNGLSNIASVLGGVAIILAVTAMMRTRGNQSV